MQVSESLIDRVCPEQVNPLSFFNLLKWLDGRSLLDVMEEYRRSILYRGLYTFRPDGAPLYRRVLTGRAKKNSKTTDAVLASLYKLLVWKPASTAGNQIFFVASDLGQANDDLDLTKKLIRVNPVLENEVVIKANVIERRDGRGFIEILAAGDAAGLHGKTYLCLILDELHTQRDYKVLEALELDRTRPDAIQWFASYASPHRQAGIPLNDFLRQYEAGKDQRLFVSWYSGTVADANPSLNGPLGPTGEDIDDAQHSLPSWIFRRLYQNLPGQPDGAAYNAEAVQACVIENRHILRPRNDLHYHAFCDLSGGGADDATLAIGHEDHGRAVVDVLVDQGSRGATHTFDPQIAVERFAALLQEYGCFSVMGDRYAGQWPVQAFQKVGITYIPAPRSRSDLYAALEPKLNSGQVDLLDDPKLIAELIGLVRKGERIDHPLGEHDDHANAVAGLVHLLMDRKSIPLELIDTGWRGYTREEIERQEAAEWHRRREDGVAWLAEQVTAHDGCYFPGD